MKENINAGYTLSSDFGHTLSPDPGHTLSPKPGHTLDRGLITLGALIPFIHVP